MSNRFRLVAIIVATLALLLTSCDLDPQVAALSGAGDQVATTGESVTTS